MRLRRELQRLNGAGIDIDSPFGLATDAAARFNLQGFIKLRDVFSAATLRHYGAEITRLTIAHSAHSAPLAERSTYDKAFLQVMNLWESSAVAREFVLGKRLGRIAAELLGVDGVRLYHDQALYKEPGGGITPAHADQYYWPLETDRVATAWIPLEAVPRSKGPVAFYARSQSEEFGRDLGISDESEREITRHLEARGFELCEEPYELGEVSFHLGWTFHRAGINASSAPRPVMTIIFMDSEMRLKLPRNANQMNDWATWCPGAKVGARIETARNPLIYRRGM
jgi:ectoine hydroxylase-related dioxygenase (phytanoyl-CoA dioxygenase family)